MKNNTEINQLVEHLFRHESGKMIAVLTRTFGSANLSLAEDIVQDTIIESIQNWTYHGVPENPSAWLYKVAKNKALNVLNREKYKKQYISSALQEVEEEENLEIIFLPEEIQDDQLRMMFTCCHPSISPDSQIALILKTLCGFNAAEIAKAFLTNTENINKRLVRARKKIRDENIPFEVPMGKDLEKKLATVLEAIYLLFNEGYSASSGEALIRYELCEEAIRLTKIIGEHHSIDQKTNVFALLALMQLNASRFKSRLDDEGNILTLEHQDRSLWDYSIMEQGFLNLEKAARDEHISMYHLLASISAFHCSAKNFKFTDWKSILSLYDRLVEIDNSPIVLLNRAVALSQVDGVEKAISTLNQLQKEKLLNQNHLFYSVLAQFYMKVNRSKEAQRNLKMAIELAPLVSEKELLKGRLAAYLKEKGE